ncbi:bifunctional hydroxymethylpyrimidine kinase/phosphomethylpyrimidine kinase [Candidatus Pelagisphaera phototrophica]|uniref:bifunctional hydroxymethylpyrimidine kinase/phosphomethylpyrimidine kinase n=1 Tax=Candidatus Pelagisphaera phototrophica TaxID=2684113 RepID=UPI001A102E05|nr:bifunctional hydroxymethylpyrimidine kinase/phosphomethylpyrimidine kinase [Candidatus Pelagisphaera phototrophica]QXD31705.1 bifunctional hydroxymethylpyrimidine kinase/phosphomethylpyrimidine kinase [Candidatus Pelagisphaera phototrophica]
MQTFPSRQVPVALTVAGSDSGGVAGMQADLLTFAANGVYGIAAMTCVTAQNPEGVVQVEVLEPEFVIKQAETVNRYFAARAAKTGLLCTQEIVEHVSEFFSRNANIRLVVDPVMVSSSGARLLSEETIDAYREHLLPIAAIITPNLDEAEILIGRPLRSPDEMDQAAQEMATEWNANIYLKGGHLEGDILYDVASTREGESRSFFQKRIRSIDTHGSGCTLSSCVAANLAMGMDAIAAIEAARIYLRRGMERPVFHSGNRFINHFPA